MDRDKLNEILISLGVAAPDLVEPFRAEEDGRDYSVWRVEAGGRRLVLKLTSPEERAVYEAFFPVTGGPVPQVLGFTRREGELYMLMEHIEGQTLSRCTREKLIPALDCLISTQEPYWGDSAHGDVGYSFKIALESREKRLPYMGDLTAAYEEYLSKFRTLPRTLCNDDLLPFNLLVGGGRAVIIDWEYAGILPYPCAIARLLAFGEEDEKELFFMTDEDREFAIEYYYDRFIRKKGVAREDYLRSLKLFFLKEYSEWVYSANLNGERDRDFEKYYNKAKRLAGELGYYTFS